MKHFHVGKMSPLWRVDMPGTPTVWSALPMPSRPDPESYLELGADAWRSQVGIFAKNIWRKNL